MQKTSSQSQNHGFFRTIPASIYSPSFYKTIGKRSFWSGFFYVLRLNLILVLIALGALGLWYKNNRVSIDETSQNFIDLYPDELVLSFQDGVLQSNVEEAYFIQVNNHLFPEKWVSKNEQFSLDVLVVDTHNEFTEEQFKNYGTYSWLGSTFFATRNEGGRIEVYPFEEMEMPNFIVTKGLFEEKMMEIWSKTKSTLVPSFFASLGFFTLLVSVIYRLIYNLFLACGIWILGKCMDHPMSYDTSYKTGFYAMTLSTLLGAVLLIPSPIFGMHFPFMFTILSLLVVALNWEAIRKGKLHS